MAAITQQDYEAVLACVGRLYDCNSLEQFPRFALEEIPKLVGADHSTFNYVAISVPKVVVLATYEPPDHSQRQQVFSRYVSDHPILKHYLATGDGSAYKISDFQSVREYHALPLYRHFYHALHYEDQLAIVLFPPGSEMISVALARDRRTFTERDRGILNLLHPHVARAYRHVEQLTLMNRALTPGAQLNPGVQATSVLLDREDRPLHFGNSAQLWISQFFPERAKAGSGLPDAVRTWLKQTRSPKTNSSGFRLQTSDSLEVQRDGQRLRLRVIPSLSDNGRILVLGLETMPAARTSLAGRLTRREIEVLLQVELGKTNDETAAALGISPLTVRTHLEHIFEKLHVPSRTAAVTHFRRACTTLPS